jgi:hypothetical protein
MVVLTENSNLSKNKEDLAKVIGNVSSGTVDNRANMRVYNILDLNIVPINVHAFMREVPFANLLNYSYTFDRMVHDFVLPNYVSDRIAQHGGNTRLMIQPTDQVASTRELMVKLLVYPYADISTRQHGKQIQYSALLASLFNGNDDLKLGRPRYLSDQLWHKVLLTSSAQLAAGEDAIRDAKSPEGGPAAYEAIRQVVNYGQLGRDLQMPRPRLTLAELALINANGAGYLPVNAGQFRAAYLAYHNTGAGYNAAHIMADAIHANATGANLDTQVQTAAIPLSIKKVSASILADPNGVAVKHIENKDAFNNAAAFNTLVTAVVANQIADTSADRATLYTAIAGAARPARVAGQVDAILHPWLVHELARREGFEAKWPEDGVGTVITPPLLAQIVGAGGHDEYKISLAANLGAKQAAAAGRECKIAQGSQQGLNLIINACNLLNVSPNVRDVLVYVAAALMAGTALNTTQGFVAALIPLLPPTVSRYDKLMIALINERLRVGGLNVNTAMPALIEDILPLHNAGIIKYLDQLMSVDPHMTSLELDPVTTAGLKYYDKANKRWRTKEAAGNMPPADVLYCAEIGRARFDTKLVRNLTWLVQLQRIMRVVLINHLSWLDTPVVKGLKIADATITEYNANDAFTDDDFNGSRYDVI